MVAEIIATINTLFTPLLKEITQEGFKLKFPTVAGIEFKDVSLDIKDHYFVVNYNFNQGGRSTSGNFGGSRSSGRITTTTRTTTGRGTTTTISRGSRTTITTNSSSRGGRRLEENEIN